MNKHREQNLYRLMCIIATMTVFSTVSECAAAINWVGGTSEWHDAGNWSGGDLPGPDDDVVIANTGANVTLTGSVSVLSLTLSKTLTFTNWNTCLTVANDVTIQSGGLMTCAGPFTNAPAMSNRVNLVCANLTIDSNGAIDVNGKGYAGGIGRVGAGGVLTKYELGFGPGAADPRGGGSHGGAGRAYGHNGAAGFLCTDDVYGEAAAPLWPGSGGAQGGYTYAFGGPGGGAVCIVANLVTVNGSITADAKPCYGGHSCGGSGGSVFITCTAITGTNGALTANGSNGQTFGGGGGGGRIAVLYDPIAQAQRPVPSIRFSTSSGEGNNNWALPNVAAADPGTLYFPDNYFLSPTNVFTGQWMVPGFTEWSVSDLLISNSWLRLPGAGFRLTVTNTLTVIGTSALNHRLELTGIAEVRCNECKIDGAELALNAPLTINNSLHLPPGVLLPDDAAVIGVTMDCAGDLTLTNSARLAVASGLSFPGGEAKYGALVNVGNNILIGSNSWIFPVAHPTNGAAVLLRMRNLTVNPFGGINADNRGYASTTRDRSASPFGPGAPLFWNSGAGHGGIGGLGTSPGTAGPTYGSSNAPVRPGSGAHHTYNATYGGWGGGSVQIRAEKTVDMQGTITADGGRGASYDKGGASGGSIYIECDKFIGHSSAILRANGGTGNQVGAGGGGGRIAVWRVFDRSPSVIANVVEGGSGGANAPSRYGENGTIVWGWLPPPSTVLLIR